MTRGIEQERLTLLRQQAVEAIQLLRARIHWKSGKDLAHLRRRIGYGHLPAEATLEDYEAIIQAMLHDIAANVYVYIWRDDIYPTVVGVYEGRRWLVMFSLAGVMETAFPPTDVSEYLSDPRFQYLGTIQELLP